jgi:ankyrin repeat protein
MHIMDDLEQTPLHSAAKSGSTACVRLLLLSGARLVPKNLPNSQGDSPRISASTPLHSAALSGHLDCLHALIPAFADHSVSLNTADSFGRTALHFAATSGHLGCVAALLDAGANPNIQCAWRATPLHFAAKSANRPAAELLIEAGADVNVTDAHGWSALHVAAKTGDTTLVDRLLSAGAATGGLTIDGETALCLALRAEHVAVVRTLAEAGSSLAAAEKLFPSLAAPVREALQKCVRATSMAGACSLSRVHGHLGTDVQHAILCRVFDVEEPFLRILLNAAAGSC